jgi:cellobiose-specific phosphotransferase system component IIC
MKENIIKNFLAYLYSNYIANFLGFAIGIASAKLVSHFFTTKSIKNLWGLTAKKTVIDKQTYGTLEMMLSLIIGFIVFEIISKWLKKKLDELWIKYRPAASMKKQVIPDTAGLAEN